MLITLCSPLDGLSRYLGFSRRLRAALPLSWSRASFVVARKLQGFAAVDDGVGGVRAGCCVHHSVQKRRTYELLARQNMVQLGSAC